MKLSDRFIAFLTLALAPLPPLHAQAATPNPVPPAAQPAIPPLEQKFRDGLYAEEATQDLGTAAKAYAEIIAAFDRDRATAASALFRLGEVHRKQNRPAEAIASFRRILQEFPDREPLARLAAENLKALGAKPPEPGPSLAGAPAPDISLEESQELARLQGLAKNSPDLLHSKTGGPDGKEVSAFLTALRAGHVKVTDFLLANGADPNRTPEGSNPLTDAALAGHKALAELLLARGADINGAGTGSGNENPVAGAIRGKAATILKLFIERGADLKKADAVIHAVNHKNTAMLKLILDAGADPDHGYFEDNRLANRASFAWEARVNYAGLLRGTGGQTDASQKLVPEFFTPLQRACVLGNPANAALLLEHGADVNAKSKLGSTALELAVITLQPDLASLLVKAGADPHHIAPGGLRLTDLAVAGNDLPTYQLLRKAGAEGGGLNPAGQPIWHYWPAALLEGSHDPTALAAALLADGVEFNNLADDTNPLVIAVGSGNLALTKLCLAHGGDAKRPRKSPLPLELIIGSWKRGQLDHRPIAGAGGRDLFPKDEITLLRTLIEAGADLNAADPDPAGAMGYSGLSALHAVAIVSKDLSTESLDKFLALKPNPHLRTARLLAEPDKVLIPAELAGWDKSDHPCNKRLWDYTWLENTPDRPRSVWLNRPALGNHGQHNQGFRGEFGPVSSGQIPGILTEYFRRTRRFPDLGKLAIHRFDPASGQTSKTEPLDLIALVKKGPPTSLPILFPGDILDMPFPGNDMISTWRDLPAPLPDFLRQATTRRITLAAGDWKRTFQVRQPLEGFRWDPSTDVLSVEPTLASLLRFTPQPDFAYQMDAVRVKLAGQAESQILDLQKAPEAGQNLILTDGSEIILTGIPANDPVLKERMAQGIFVSRAKDGFLREVLRNTGAPPGIDNKVTVDDVREMSLTASDWVLPKPVRDPFLNGETWPSNGPLVWGQTLEMPRDMEAEGIPWTGSSPERPADLPIVTVIRRDSQSFPLALYRGNSIFQLEEDGWSVRYSPGPQKSMSNSSVTFAPAWYIKNRSLAALADEIAPDKSTRGVWELQSSRLNEPLRIDLRGREPPFILLESDDTLMVERDEPLLELKASNGIAARRPIPTSPQPPPRRHVVLPLNGQ